MAPPLPSYISLLLFPTGITAHANFTMSKAAYYRNSTAKGTENFQAEHVKAFGAMLNNGDVSASANLYRNGVGCGSSYQVRCTDPYYCSADGVTIAITDSGSTDGTDFILSEHAFAGMAQTANDGAARLALGHVRIEHRRVSCNYPNKNIVFKINQRSDCTYYLEFEIWYQQGSQDIIAVQFCEIVNLTCRF